MRLPLPCYYPICLTLLHCNFWAILQHETWFYIFSGFTKMECTQGKSRILWILIWRIWIWVTMLSTGLTTNIPGKSKSRSCNRSKTLFKSSLFGLLEKWVGYLGQSTSSIFFLVLTITNPIATANLLWLLGQKTSIVLKTKLGHSPVSIS